MKELIESIEEYIRRPYTDYAVMINGEWGSGKTHFWNNKLRQRIENIRNKKGDLYKTIYISLYGINSLEEISKKIFLETNPMMSKALKKFADNVDGNVIPEYVKTGVDIANLYGAIQPTNTQTDFAKVFSTDDKVLCFDDLERANIDIVDILGYINNFVEHDGIKTILICNEKELAIKFKNNNIEMKTLIATMILAQEGEFQKIQKAEVDKPLATIIDDRIRAIFDRTNAYERIKEKLIGECFEYMPEYSYILNGMLIRYEYNAELSRFLKREIATIINIFNKTNTKNLRVLKHALNDFEKIYNMVTYQYSQVTPELMKTLLMFTIAISFEIKVGAAVKQQFGKIANNEEYKSILYTSNLVNDDASYYIKEFDTRYFLNSKSDYRFFKFVEIYVRTRTFNEKVFRDNMEEALQKKETKKDGEYIKLLNGTYWQLSDFDFSILIDQVLFDVKEGLIPTKDILKLFSVYKYLCEIGVIRYYIEEIKDKFLLGYKMSLMNDIKFNITTMDFSMEDIKDFKIKDFASECNKLKLAIYDEALREKVSNLFKNLIDNVDEFYKQIMNDFADIPIFQKYEMSVLYDKLRMLSNFDLYNFISVVSTRYENNTKLLEQDKKNLGKLAEIIRDNTKDVEPTIKTALQKSLAEAIERII
ncbi:MAG: hypothetical protein IKV94_01000 [Clostridia bacterium]|nr:hypothetical protein [Clostridia bacterium]